MVNPSESILPAVPSSAHAVEGSQGSKATGDMHDLVIISAGKYGRETYSFVQDAIDAGAPWSFKGFLDDRHDALKPYGYAAVILGSVDSYHPQPGDRFLCAIGENDLRQHYAELIVGRGGMFTTLIHPSAVVSRRANLGTGCIVEPFAFIGADVVIGDFNIIGSHACIGHDSLTGDWCHVCGHSALGGGVRLEDSCFVGLGAVVVPNVTIFRQAFVGAGSIIIGDVPQATKVFGNPAVAFGKAATKSTA